MTPLLRDIFILLRPHQWVKNLLVLAAPFFGGVLYTSYGMFFIMLIAFVAFSLASSAGYIANDIADLESDKRHPTKKLRPLAAGRISTHGALVIAVLALLLSITCSLMIGPEFLMIIAAYICLSLLYSFYLRRLVIIDCFSIAIGFVLRIEAGGVASDVVVSNWLLLTTFLLSLLLALGKRRSELTLAVHDPGIIRESLSKYTENFLDTSIAIFATTSIVTYAIYSIEVETRVFLITLPFACYGVLRYIYLVQTAANGDPTESLLRDPPLLLCVILWLAITAFIIYYENIPGLS